MISDYKLEKCLFCCSNEHLKIVTTPLKDKTDNIKDFKSVICLQCGACGPYCISDAIAVEAFNSRPQVYEAVYKETVYNHNLYQRKLKNVDFQYIKDIIEGIIFCLIVFITLNLYQGILLWNHYPHFTTYSVLGGFLIGSFIIYMLKCIIDVKRLKATNEDWCNMIKEAEEERVQFI